MSPHTGGVTCNAGASCGLCLTAIPSSECPADPDLPQCDSSSIADGALCDGDGECGTNGSLDNCDNGYDVYRKHQEPTPTTGGWEGVHVW